VSSASYLPEDFIFGVDEAAAFLEFVGLLFSFLLHFKSSIIIAEDFNEIGERGGLQRN
jgi:hypothetical protein